MNLNFKNYYQVILVLRHLLVYNYYRRRVDSKFQKYKGQFSTLEMHYWSFSFIPLDL